MILILHHLTSSVDISGIFLAVGIWYMVNNELIMNTYSASITTPSPMGQYKVYISQKICAFDWEKQTNKQTTTTAQRPGVMLSDDTHKCCQVQGTNAGSSGYPSMPPTQPSMGQCKVNISQNIFAFDWKNNNNNNCTTSRCTVVRWYSYCAVKFKVLMQDAVCIHQCPPWVNAKLTFHKRSMHLTEKTNKQTNDQKKNTTSRCNVVRWYS